MRRTQSRAKESHRVHNNNDIPFYFNYITKIKQQNEKKEKKCSNNLLIDATTRRKKLYRITSLLFINRMWEEWENKHYATMHVLYYSRSP